MIKRFGYIFLALLFIIIPLSIIGCDMSHPNEIILPSDNQPTIPSRPEESEDKSPLPQEPVTPGSPKKQVALDLQFAQDVITLLENSGVLLTSKFNAAATNKDLTISFAQSSTDGSTSEEIKDILLDAFSFGDYQVVVNLQFEMLIITISAD